MCTRGQKIPKFCVRTLWTLPNGIGQIIEFLKINVSDRTTAIAYTATSSMMS